MKGIFISHVHKIDLPTFPSENLHVMAQPDKLDIEPLRFHWDKWREEANRFWRHVAITTVILIAFSMFQLDVVQLDFPHVKLTLGSNATVIKRWLICPISIWLLTAIAFGLVDLTRHRVPENQEHIIHNNRYPFPGFKNGVNLKPIGRGLYIISTLLYFMILVGWVSYCSWKVWHSP